jgi:branched-chain amino acid transport system permease protein
MAQLIIGYGLVNGGIYALLSLGFSLIFGVARVLNLAHTAFFMLAAYSMWYLVSERMGILLGYIPASIITVVVVTLLGMLSYKLLMDRVREHPATVLLITIALAMAIQEILTWRFQADTRGIPSPISGVTRILGFTFYNENLVILGVVAVIVIILWLLLSKTKMGVAIRATANDSEIASLMGISVSRILLITMGIATALAAVAGVVVAPLWAMTPSMWGEPLMIIMVIVVLGGLGSIKGSVIGAFIIGFVSQVASMDPLNWFGGGGAYMTLTFILLAMVIVLIVRPGGLFGVMFEEERL